MVFSHGDLGAVKIGHDVKGSAGTFSGIIQSHDGNVGRVPVGGSLIGGATSTTGVISSAGTMGAVKIGLDVLGGSTASSGLIQSGGSDHFGFVAELIGSFKVGGTAIPLLPAMRTTTAQSAFTGDVTIHEVRTKTQLTPLPPHPSRLTRW